MAKHGIWLGALLLTGCGLNELDPPATPPRAPVTIDPQRIPAVRPPGTGRVALDAVGGETRVEEVVDLSAGFEAGSSVGALARVSTVPLCLSPCVADFGYGHHILRYTSSAESVENVSFAPLHVKKGSITILRHAPGHYRTYPTRQSLGSFSMVAGMPLFLVGIGLFGLGSSNLGGDSPDAANLRGSLKSGGAVSMLIGGALTTLGIALKVAGRDEYQPGATVQFEEPEPPEPKPPPAKEPAPEPAAPPPAASPEDRH